MLSVALCHLNSIFALHSLLFQGEVFLQETLPDLHVTTLDNLDAWQLVIEHNVRLVLVCSNAIKLDAAVTVGRAARLILDTRELLV